MTGHPLLYRWPTLPLVLMLGTFAALAGCSSRDDTTLEAERGEPQPVAARVQVEGVTIAYERFGPDERETILLIAGTGMQLIDWPIELVHTLVDRGYHVVRFDNRDTGLSTTFDDAGLPDPAAIGKALEAGEPAPVPYTLRDMAADVVGLLDALGVQQAHLVGVSMGGAIAQFVAIDYPDHVRSLTSIGADSGNPNLPVIANPEAFAAVPPPPAPGDREAFVAYQVQVERALASPDYRASDDEIRARVQRSVARAYNPEALVRQQTVSYVGHIESARYRRERLGTIAVPTVVVHGAADPLVSVEAARDIAARVPGAELRVIPGMGHDLPVALVPTFADAVASAASAAGSDRSPR